MIAIKIVSDLHDDFYEFDIYNSVSEKTYVLYLFIIHSKSLVSGWNTLQYAM